MYPGEKLWFLPDDGSEPYEVTVGSAREALERDPKHYSRAKPEVAAEAPVAEEPPLDLDALGGIE